jgi:F-type H+-transporting ATPase subunit gamma
MENRERVEARLEHISSVEPILSAMRTISLAAWRTALNQRAALLRYRRRLSNILSVLPPHLGADWRARHAPRKEPAHVLVTVLGSERGLCGQFNAAVAMRADQHLSEDLQEGTQVTLLSLGTRVTRILRRRRLDPDWSGALSLTTLPPFSLSLDLTQQWLARYKAGEITEVNVVHNVYRGGARYQPQTTSLIPPQVQAGGGDPPSGPSRQPRGAPWPPTIVETDPVSLFDRVIEQQTATEFHGLLLDSAAAEHSARYQLMEGATQNAERLIAELTMAVQSARQQQITREMQELAAGAGLLGRQRAQPEIS